MNSLVPKNAIEIIPDKLYFLITSDFSIRQDPKLLYHSTDSTLVYTAFFADFGPLDLGLTHQFCVELDILVRNTGNKPVVYHCSDHPHRRSNSAVLICAYLVYHTIYIKKLRLK